jgi:DNA-binding CsgD family transcriptional regulator
VTADAIVGREAELRALRAAVDRGGDGLRAVVLQGEAGSGKSTLWAAGVETAERRGLRVLAARPAEAERGLAYVVLADLLETAAAEVLPALPGSQRRALEVALLTAAAPAEPLDPRALGVAVRSCLRVLAADAAVVLAIDDVQWIDASSSAALAFALRRLHAEPLVLLLARRTPAGAGAGGLALEAAVPPAAVERVEVGALSAGALQLLLQRRLGRALARPTLLRVHETSAGNPFYALELARAVAADADLGEPLRVPATLERLVGARLAALEARTHDALLLVAAHGRLPPPLARAAGVGEDALRPAFEAEVVELSAGTVQFTHPLLASVLYHGAPVEERRGAHRRLAAVVEDTLERARHLRLAATAPSEALAATLEDAARLAASRGAVLAAAELGEHALRLTPVDDGAARHRRAVAAARALLAAAATARARELAAELLPQSHGESRAELLVVLSELELADAHMGAAIELRREALALAESRRLQAEIHQFLGRALRYTENVATADRHAATAVELAERLGDEALRVTSLSALALGRFRAGEPGALELIEEAASLAGVLGGLGERRRVRLELVQALVWSFRLERARALLDVLERESSEEELSDDAATAAWYLGMVELRAGRFARAAEQAERAREIARQYATDDDEPPSLVWLAGLVAAHRGELERARRLAERSRALAAGQPSVRAGQDALIGLVELWSGSPDASVVRFEVAERDRGGAGVREPAMFWWRAEHAEALVALGRLDEAEALLDVWGEGAMTLGREAVLAQVSRSRGLLASARGEPDTATAELERAVAQHEAVGDPFGRARSLHALGVAHRRARRQRAAREALEAALAGFEECGAAGWAASARTELGRIGGRRRGDGLTPAEARVAELVAGGRTNREVASALYLTEHTVEKTLTRVYRKLEVRSRAELARRLAGESGEA